ncbi:replication initiator [Mycolicibacterium aubagnense]|uniref:replication initiator n=1 Tax=Mycolicibacterium aubagnense TaxID=319707 RepID=UPI00389925E1
MHTPGDEDTAAAVAVRFGTQIDTQSLTAESSVIHDASNAGLASGFSARRVACYLAKYVTKSLQDFGIAARRLSTEAIAALDVTEHTRSILFAIAALDHHAVTDAARESPWTGIGRWLHTLGYRGHITTKSRHYSTTMTALRVHRAEWTATKTPKPQQRNMIRWIPRTRLDGKSIALVMLRQATESWLFRPACDISRPGAPDWWRSVTSNRIDQGAVMIDNSNTAHPHSEGGDQVSARILSEGGAEIVVPEDYVLPCEANRALIRVILAIRDRTLGGDRGVA